MQTVQSLSSGAPHLHHILGGSPYPDLSLEKRYNSLKCYLTEGLALKIERGDVLSPEELDIPNVRLILQLYTRIKEANK